VGKEKRMKRELHVLRTELSKQIRVGEPKAIPENEIVSISEKIAPEKIEPVIIESKKSEIVKEDKKVPATTKPKRQTVKSQEEKKCQMSLSDFGSKERKLAIIADTREFNSEVVKELSRKGIVVESQQLDVADYILSDRLAVERKEVDDFLASLMDGRLFSQLKMLKSAYINPILVLEGEGLLSRRGISDQAIIGALASIISDFNISIISTTNVKETANLLAIMVKREFDEGRPVGIRGEKVSMSLSERQQFIIEGLPGVSATLAQRLLAHFGSVEAIMAADEKKLCEVKGIGDTIAKGIVDVIKSGYLKK
jgi:Fanconi anemia group M protein